MKLFLHFCNFYCSVSNLVFYILKHVLIKSKFQIESTLATAKTNADPITGEAQESAEETLSVLAKMDGEDNDVHELSKILTRPWLDGLLSVHDQISALKSDNQYNSNEDALIERLSRYSEPDIKIVRIEKGEQPLGATVKNEPEGSTDSVVIARIIRGATVDASGLLQEGDEILEVNETPLRGKDVNEVYDILSNMQGTLTFLVVPTRQHQMQSSIYSHQSGGTLPQNGAGGVTPNNSGRHGVIHLKVSLFK